MLIYNKDFVLFSALLLAQMIQSVAIARRRIPGPKSSPGARGSSVDTPEEPLYEGNGEDEIEENSIEEPESGNILQPVSKEIIGSQKIRINDHGNFK